MNRLFVGDVTTKENGKGIGLISAYRYITSLGGRLEVISKEGYGTTVEIILSTVSGNFEINEVEELSKLEESKSSEFLDFILIDDDKYIRLSCEYFAKN